MFHAVKGVLAIRVSMSYAMFAAAMDVISSTDAMYQPKSMKLT
jgi:hypothetical protein